MYTLIYRGYYPSTWISYHSISIHNAILPVIGYNFSGSIVESLSHTKVSTYVWDGAWCSTTSPLGRTTNAAVFIGYTGSLDGNYVQLYEHYQRPALQSFQIE